MPSSTVELIALWASSSPSLLAFCFSHLIIAVLLLGGRGCAQSGISGGAEWTSGADEIETLDGTRVQGEGEKMSGGGQDDSPTTRTIAVSVVEHRHGCAADGDVHGRVAEADTDVVQLEEGDKRIGAEKRPPAATAGKVQDKCGDNEEDDELMMRAEEFIQRMNRVWRAENVHFC